MVLFVLSKLRRCKLSSGTLPFLPLAGMLSGLPQARACPRLNGENSETASEINQAAKRGKRTMHGLNAYGFDRLHFSFDLKMRGCCFLRDSHLGYLGSVLQ